MHGTGSLKDLGGDTRTWEDLKAAPVPPRRARPSSLIARGRSPPRPAGGALKPRSRGENGARWEPRARPALGPWPAVRVPPRSITSGVQNSDGMGGGVEGVALGRPSVGASRRPRCTRCLSPAHKNVAEVLHTYLK